MPINKPPMVLSDDYKYVLDTLERTDKSMFITGRAGTGKSTLLKLFRDTTRKKTVVLAPTGVAALNVKGQTIHSFFGFPPKLLSKSDIKKKRSKKLFKKLEVLIVDEVSMVRADLLDNMDYSLRLHREDPRPFGGVQMVFFGDVFQLPPVVAREEEKNYLSFYYDSPFFFSSESYKLLGAETIELRKIYRQEERHFIRLLDAVRLNQIDYDDLEDLNERHVPDFEETGNSITLTTRNYIVDSINLKELKKLPTKEYIYPAKISGDFNTRLYPTDLVLKLREGAQVMFLRNDPERRFVNGSIGKVVFLSDEKVVVEIKESGKTKKIEVEPETWEIIKYKMDDKKEKIETEITGEFIQYPLRAAWAITIHKSQGKTFDRVIIDMGKGAFEHGQTYVALSRCRTLGGIVLKQKLRFQDVMVNDKVVDFYQQNFD